jgi:hypothetical protein
MVEVSTPSWGDPGDPELEFGAIETCCLCYNKFYTERINQIECDVCDRKPQSWKERVWKDNQQQGNIYGRLGDRSPMPIKVGGQVKGRIIEEGGESGYRNYQASVELSKTDAWWDFEDPGYVLNETVDDLVARNKIDRRIGEKFKARKVA